MTEKKALEGEILPPAGQSGHLPSRVNESVKISPLGMLEGMALSYGMTRALKVIKKQRDAVTAFAELQEAKRRVAESLDAISDDRLAVARASVRLQENARMAEERYRFLAAEARLDDFQTELERERNIKTLQYELEKQRLESMLYGKKHSDEVVLDRSAMEDEAAELAVKASELEVEATSLEEQGKNSEVVRERERQLRIKIENLKDQMAELGN